MAQARATCLAACDLPRTLEYLLVTLTPTSPYSPNLLPSGASGLSLVKAQGDCSLILQSCRFEKWC
jgi:hypothetical protein